MTIDEFLAALEKTPRQWEKRCGRLRNGGGPCDCPLTAVAGPLLPRTGWRTPYWNEAAMALGISESDATDIVHAADNEYSDAGSLKPLRDKILKACGLKVDDSPTK